MRNIRKYLVQLSFVVMTIVGTSFTNEIKTIIMKYWAEILFFTGILGLLFTTLFQLYHAIINKKITDTVEDKVDCLKQSAKFNEFVSSLDDTYYNTTEAQTRYLSIRQKHIEKALKIKENIDVDSVVITFDNESDTIFYNEYKRVNNEYTRNT